MSHCPGFQPLVYIICVLASRLLSWVRMFSGLGILVAPRSSTFRVNLGGYFSLHFFIPREEVLINNALNSCGFVFADVFYKRSFFYRMVRVPPPDPPMLGEALAAVAQGTSS